MPELRKPTGHNPVSTPYPAQLPAQDKRSPPHLWAGLAGDDGRGGEESGVAHHRTARGRRPAATRSPHRLGWDRLEYEKLTD